MRNAIDTMDHFPSIAELAGISEKLGLAHSHRWKYFEVDDCFTCGGTGWHFAFRKDGPECIVACDDCRAGKNMQAAPKPHINIAMKNILGATYSRPGRESSGHPLHPELKRRFRNWEGLNIAINEGALTMVDFHAYLDKKLNNLTGKKDDPDRI